MATSMISVRHFNPEESDLTNIQSIWSDGLSQTFEESNLFIRLLGNGMFGLMSLYTCGPWVSFHPD